MVVYCLSVFELFTTMDPNVKGQTKPSPLQLPFFQKARAFLIKIIQMGSEAENFNQVWK